MQLGNLIELTFRAQGIADLINQAFLHVDVIGPHVIEGHYNLIGPSGEIILPLVWDNSIEPDMAITMHMWPFPEPLPDGPPKINDGNGNGNGDDDDDDQSSRSASPTLVDTDGPKKGRHWKM